MSEHRLSKAEENIADDLVRMAGIPKCIVDSLPREAQLEFKENVLLDAEYAFLHGKMRPNDPKERVNELEILQESVASALKKASQ